VKRGWIVVIALLLLLSSGCGGSSKTSIQIDDAWARAAKAAEMENQDQTSTETGGMGHMSGSLSAAYMVITNNSDQPDRLLRASSDAAHTTELHISEIVDGVMSMHPVDSVEVPANGQAELKPGGLHIMLIGLTGDLVAGEKMPLTLEFENAGKIQVEAEIRAP
jgi:hypothetical protein